eukprot:4907128-Prorocentrum_lima.AAC.1
MIKLAIDCVADDIGQVARYWILTCLRHAHRLDFDAIRRIRMRWPERELDLDKSQRHDMY